MRGLCACSNLTIPCQDQLKSDQLKLEAKQHQLDVLSAVNRESIINDVARAKQLAIDELSHDRMALERDIKAFHREVTCHSVQQYSHLLIYSSSLIYRLELCDSEAV